MDGGAGEGEGIGKKSKARLGKKSQEEGTIRKEKGTVKGLGKCWRLDICNVKIFLIATTERKKKKKPKQRRGKGGKEKVLASMLL